MYLIIGNESTTLSEESLKDEITEILPQTSLEVYTCFKVSILYTVINNVVHVTITVDLTVSRYMVKNIIGLSLFKLDFSRMTYLLSDRSRISFSLLEHHYSMSKCTQRLESTITYRALQ